jgi:hypothetical protein
MFVVIVLAEISKRSNPQIAGIIVGLPLGTGLSIYFITLEQGVEFTVRGVPWGIVGLAGAIIFCLVYLLSSRVHFIQNKILRILFSSAVSIIVFILLGYLINLLNLNLLKASVIFLFVFLINLWVVNRIIAGQGQKVKSKSTYKQYFLRGLVVGGILMLITAIAPLVGSKWANILSSFPSTLFTLLLILHYEDDDQLFPYVIYGYSYSITTLFIFYILYTYFVPIFDLNMGYLIIYILCGCYLYIFQKILYATTSTQGKLR